MRYVPFALPDAAWHRRLDELRFGFHKWDLHVRGRGTVARGALVLTRREHDELTRHAEALDALATRHRRELAREPALGVPPELTRLVTDQEGPRVTRQDWFLTDEGWRVSELNDDVPGGYNDALGLPALFADAAEDKGLVVEGDLPDALARALAGRRVGLVHATAYAEDLQVARVVGELLDADVALASPEALDPAWDCVFRFYPAEWFPLLPNLDAWTRAVQDGLRVVNPFSCAWTQSKAFFLWLHETGRATEHVPLTVPFDPDAPREGWVLKPAFGRMGEGIVLGDAVPEKEWRAALVAAQHRRRLHVLQRRFRPVPVETDPGQTRIACVGVYLVDGRFAGYYSRLSDTRVVAYDAANVLTLVEPL